MGKDILMAGDDPGFRKIAMRRHRRLYQV